MDLVELPGGRRDHPITDADLDTILAVFERELHYRNIKERTCLSLLRRLEVSDLSVLSMDVEISQAEVGGVVQKWLYIGGRLVYKHLSGSSQRISRREDGT